MKKNVTAESNKDTAPALNKFFIPTLGVTVEAKDLEEANAKALAVQEKEEVGDGNI